MHICFLPAKFTVNMPETKACNLECPPRFIVPLKMHAAPQGYECYMSCAIKGDPTPHVTWLRNNISLNTNTNYYISNTCGVCSLLILRVGPKDTGEYTIVAENSKGRAECSTKLTVRGKSLPECTCISKMLSMFCIDMHVIKGWSLKSETNNFLCLFPPPE